MVLKKVYSLECVEDHTKDLAWTYKVYQEKNQFTDVQLVCADGAKVGAHGAVLLRHCPQLRMIAAKFACCFCHGTECGGSAKNTNLVSLSLPDFSKSTIVSFLELIYTGRTYFQDTEDYDNVVDLGKHLGFALPASGLSLIQNDEEESPTRVRASTSKAKNKRSLQTANSSASKRSRISRLTDPENEPIANLQPEPTLSKQCTKCSMTFPSKMALTKHLKTCQQVDDVPINNAADTTNDDYDDAEQDEEVTEGGKKKKCKFCGKSFANKGGWHTKHVKTCRRGSVTNNDDHATTNTSINDDHATTNTSINDDHATTNTINTTNEPIDVQDDIEDLEDAIPRVEVIINTNSRRESTILDTSNNDNETLGTSKKDCPNCGKSFPMSGGRFTKHMTKCQVKMIITDEDQDAENSDQDVVVSCPKCNKFYAPQVRRFLKDHIATCNGITADDRVKNVDPDDPEVLPEEAASADMSTYEAMYARGEWNCYMCTKWFGRRDVLRQHLLIHYKKDLKKDFIPEGSDPTVCSLCSHVARNHKALLQHISIAAPHQKLRDHLPDYLASLLFPKKTEADDSYMSLDTSEADLEAAAETPPPTRSNNKKWKCCVCKKDFPERPQLTDHIVDHFSSQILNRFVENGTKCTICRYHDANLNQLTRHVALQHEKIREYIPALEGDSLFTINNKIRPQPTQENENEETPSEVEEQQPLNLEKPNKDDAATVSPTGLDCYICSKPHRTRSDLRQHIFCHLRVDIQTKFYPDNEPVKLCVECNYRSTVGEHVLMHLALKHQKLREFVPDHILPLLYAEKSTTRRSSTATATTTTPSTPSTPSATNSPKKTASQNLSCVRCKAVMATKAELRTHLESCEWHCDLCKVQLRDPKRIKQHRAKCGLEETEEASSAAAETTPTNLGLNLICQLCQRSFKNFNYLKSHISMHFRSNLKEKVNSWGGGIGGSGYGCRLCDFVANNRDSLVTHAGYKHALFVEFMPPDMRLEFYENALKYGEKTELWAEHNDSQAANRYTCRKCKKDFDNQLSLASHMTNTNCQTVIAVRCLLCDIEVGSVMQYKNHLLVHYQTNVENEVIGLFKELGGCCKSCHPDGSRMEFQDFTRHFALEHDKLRNVLTPEVKTHLSLAFPNTSSMIRQSDDSKEPPKEDFDEEIHIEIEPVDDHVVNTTPRKDDDDEIVKTDDDQDHNSKKD